VKRKLNPRLKWGCLTPFAVFLALILGVYLLDTFVPSAARRALADSATDVQEYYSGSWNGDYVRCLRAKLPEADFPLYAKNLGLTDRFDPVAHADIESMINIGFGDSPAWWTPPVAGPTTYFQHKRGDDFLQVLKFSDGYAFFVSTSW
jgi:hypothetical protein